MGHEIVRTKFGAHLYGTETPTSDEDWRAVRVPNRREILLGSTIHVISQNTKTDNSQKNSPDDTDGEIWSLRHFFQLVGEGQPVALDLLFSPPSAWIGEPSFIWRDIVENRHRLISSRSARFIKYCRQQANKYGIKGSRMAAASQAVQVLSNLYLERPNCILGEVGDRVEAELRGIEHIDFVHIPGPSMVAIKHLEVCGCKAPYTASLKGAVEMYTRLYDKYGARARAAMNQEGIDWKALSHAVRVGREALELLLTKHITFPRPEAELLVKIKTGQLPYRQVSELIEDLLVRVEAAQKESYVRPVPDFLWMESTLEAAHYGSVCQGR